MNRTTIFFLSVIFFLPSLSVKAQPDTLMRFLEPFIGEWYVIPDAGMLKDFPEMASSIAFKFEWAHDNHKILRFYEGIPEGDMQKRVLENLVAVNPRSGAVEFLGYQMRDDFLFKGQFEPLLPEGGFIRLYDVYYPHGTQFRQKRDEMKGMKSYRDICRLIGKDTLECTTEQLNSGLWKPWGNGKPYRMVRQPRPNKAIPQWVLDDWANRTRGSGIWITDNAAYKGDQEPYDAYGIQWEYGLGEKHLKGRLYCIKDGKDVGTVWQFTEYWDPASAALRVVQIGSDGTVGQGKIWPEEDGRIKELQTFVSPGGGSFQSGHLMWMENGEQHTQSYNIVNGEWIKRRFYVWKLRK